MKLDDITDITDS